MPTRWRSWPIKSRKPIGKRVSRINKEILSRLDKLPLSKEISLFAFVLSVSKLSFIFVASAFDMTRYLKSSSSKPFEETYSFVVIEVKCSIERVTSAADCQLSCSSCLRNLVDGDIDLQVQIDKV